MYTKIISDPKFYSILLKYDEDLAAQCWAEPCPHCGDKLNQAHYVRKPRGGPMSPEEAVRFSYCCRAKGCRRRKTPPSLRFIGPKVYLSVLVTLVAAMSQGLSPKRVKKLRAETGVSRQTLSRWRHWWLGYVPRTSFWKEARGQFRVPVSSDSLPASLTQYFQSIQNDLEESVVILLRFITPLGVLGK